MSNILQDGAFWLGISAAFVGVYKISISYMLKSKCKTCSICYGCIKTERAVELEVDEEKYEIEKGINIDAVLEEKK